MKKFIDVPSSSGDSEPYFWLSQKKDLMVRFWLIISFLFCCVNFPDSGFCQETSRPSSAGKKASLKEKAPPLKIVGSEVVFPYAAIVGEHFAENHNESVPVLESVGTGAGVALFCRGRGLQTSSILMASRQMTREDYKICEENGVDAEEIIEIPIGLDGIILTQSQKALPLFLTSEDVFKALSAGNMPLPQKWDQVSPSFPHVRIRILGPAGVSGTYDSLLTLMLKPFCQGHSQQKNCEQIRHDRVYTEMGPNQNLLIEKLKYDRELVGLITFGFFMKNQSHLRAIPIDGIEPTFENLWKRIYPFLRPLYLYFKKSHAMKIPQLILYVESFFKPDAIDFWGYLVGKGLIPLMEEEQQTVRKRLDTLKRLSDVHKSL